MTSRYLLDTDHISLAQRGHPHISARILATPPEFLAVSIITVQEQLQGRLAQVQAARDMEALVRAYQALHEAVTFHRAIPILDFDERAAAIFTSLRQQKLRIGTLDLRIAAVALAAGATLITRNRRDFDRAPGLVIEDWSTPM
ncbi:MAG: type II toxin-antitoxin system VapC family toxin [Chloroflexota bacterium]